MFAAYNLPLWGVPLPAAWSSTEWIVLFTGTTAAFTGLAALIMGLQYVQARRVYGERRPIELSNVRDIRTVFEPAMECWKTSTPIEQHLRCMRRLSACIVNRSSVDQEVTITCKVVWPRCARLYHADSPEFLMPAYRGGNFDLRLLDFDWLDLPDQEIEGRRSQAHLDTKRYLVKVRAETVSGYGETRWTYTTLPIFGEHVIQRMIRDAQDDSFDADYALAGLIDEGARLRDVCRASDQDRSTLKSDLEDWQRTCRHDLSTKFGPSIAAAFRSEGSSNDQCTMIDDKLGFLKRLAAK